MRINILLVVLFVNSLNLSAQISKGSFMLEGGINLTDHWAVETSNYIEGFGISFGTSDYKGKDVTEREIEYPTAKYFGFSVSPRLGYSVFQNFVVGPDFKYRYYIYWNSPYKSEYKTVDRVLLYGLFARKYFGNQKLSPFIEGGFGFGSKKYSESAVSPGGAHYRDNDLSDLAYYAGVLGCSYSVNTKFKINLFAKLQHTQEVADYMLASRRVKFDSALVLSFSYFLNRKIAD